MNRFLTWYRLQPPALRALLTVNVVIYVLWQVVFVHVGVVAAFVGRHLALNPAWPGITFEPWQLLTYSVLHLNVGFWGFLHLLFNMLWLVWIGREYEELHGSARLLGLYVFGALGGSLLTVLLHALFPGVMAFSGPVHGASAAVLAVMTTVGVLYPYKSIGLFLIGTVRLIWVVVGFLVLDILFLAGGGNSVSAHLGGALFGLLFAKAAQQGVDLSAWAEVFFGGRRPRRRAPAKAPARRRFEAIFPGGRAARAEADRPRARASAEAEAPRAAPASSLEREVDRILDKISAQGYDALTDEEKRVLYEASRR